MLKQPKLKFGLRYMRLKTDRADASVAIGFVEFVALAAALMSIQALAIDAMLPALPAIVRELTVSNPNHAQWIITIYIVGFGIGQLFWGVMADRFGRRPVLICGVALYVLAAVLCSLTDNFSVLLVWRLAHGLAAASVVVIRSVIRDLYSGRNMARVMSLTFVVFLTVPIIAPSLGQLILWVLPWRSIFILCGIVGVVVWQWAYLRLPETLHVEYRLTLNRLHILSAIRLVLNNRISVFYTLATTLMFGSLLAYVSTVQQIFSDVFHQANLMPGMFALCAIFMGMAAYVNSLIVGKLGMRHISHAALIAFIAITAMHSLVAYFGFEKIWTFVLLQSFTMATFSLSVSNFGAMAMEPLGKVAGIAVALQGFTTSAGGAVIGALIGWEFGGTTLPLAMGAMCCGMLALCCVMLAENGRLFSGHHETSLAVGA